MKVFYMPWDKHGAPWPPAASTEGWRGLCQSLKGGKQTLPEQPPHPCSHSHLSLWG